MYIKRAWCQDKARKTDAVTQMILQESFENEINSYIVAVTYLFKNNGTSFYVHCSKCAQV